jgi:PAS domain S-box-containing protein
MTAVSASEKQERENGFMKECQWAEVHGGNRNSSQDISLKVPRAASPSIVCLSEELFSTVFSSAPNPMALLTPDGRFLQVNAAFCRLLGYAQEELLDATFELITFPGDQERDHSTLQKLLTDKITYHQQEKRYRHKTDGAVWVSVCVSLVCDTQHCPQYLIVQMHDLTEQKRSEAALRHEREITAALLDNANTAVIAFDLEGRIVRFNQASEKISGYTLYEAIGVPVWDLLLPPDEVASFREVFARLQQQVSPTLYEQAWRTKHGETRQLLWSYVPLFQESGSVDYVVGIGIDVTEQKQLEMQLTLSRKMDSIGRLAAGIAHEINTPLQYIGDNARFLGDAFEGLHSLLDGRAKLLAAAKTNAVSTELIQQVEAEAQAVDQSYLTEEIPLAIEQALHGVSHVSTIVRGMKEFSHPGAEEKGLCDLNHAIETTIAISRNEWKYVADLTTDFDVTLPRVPCWEGEFNQVLLNLIVNAAHAIADVVKDESKGKGRITIRTRHDGAWAEVRISDTGTGIPEAVRAKMFDPFFTTKGVGKGTGQGLAIAYAVIVKKHQGTLFFETEIGSGTTFVLRLPLSTAPLDTGDSHETAHSLCG